LAELLEAGTGEGCVEINTLEQGVDLDGGRGRRRERTFGTFASSPETTDGTGVGRDIYTKDNRQRYAGTTKERYEPFLFLRLNS
jgi:hypothetical protein